MAAKDTIIMGVDPGTSVLGYGIIAVKKGQYKLLSMGVVHLQKQKDHYDRLAKIYARVEWLIREYQPEELSIEAPFYGKNPQSMLKLGRAQGVAIAAAIAQGVPVFEYAPRKIKQAITGNGNSSKEQVAKMLKHLITYDANPKFHDATDGLAAAICHHLQQTNPLAASSASKGNSWSTFIKNNPDKIG